MQTVQQTDRECSQCEDGVYYKYDDDLLCGTCHYTPDRTSSYSGVNGDGEWERWWDEREQYDGFYGPDRVRFVGGFPGSYP